VTPGRVGNPADPLAVLKSRRYLGLLVVTAVLGVPLSAMAYGFLKLSSLLESWLYTDLPNWLGFDSPPTWWPVPVLATGGVVVAAVIKYLPGGGGESPAHGFKPGGVPAAAAIPGIVLAALATLGSGAVLGPEAPLVALGAALAVLTVRLVKRGTPAQVIAVVGAAGSFASIGTLLGSPLAGAFLLMEAAGLAGSMLEVVLVPGLLASAIGALIFVGLDSWTGFGTFSLTVPQLPGAPRPDIAQFAWAIGIGIAAAILGWGIRRGAVLLQPHVSRHRMLLTPVVGIAIAGLAIGYAEATGQKASDVLFSGQTLLPTLIDHSAEYSVGALLMLLLCKGVAYSASMSSFRGGPTFPGMFLGAAGGIALSHLPGLPMVTGAAMGIAAMTTAMLRLPFTAVLITSLFLLPDALTVMPVEVVAAVVAYVVIVRLPEPAAGPGEVGPRPATHVTRQVAG
jgi:H+/Cl- antiporter ClcA